MTAYEKEFLTQCTVLSKRRNEEAAAILKRYVVDAVITAAGRNARLADFDEQLFFCYRQLIDSCRDVVTLYDTVIEHMKTISIRYILSGICSVLNARIRVFDENYPEPSQNPVTNEKRSIIYTTMQQIGVLSDESFLNGETIYEVYLNTVSLIDQNLREIEDRKVLDQLLKNVTDELHTCKNVLAHQMIAADQQIMRHAGNMTEQEELQRIIAEIKAAYGTFMDSALHLTEAMSGDTTDENSLTEKSVFIEAAKELLVNPDRIYRKSLVDIVNPELLIAPDGLSGEAEDNGRLAETIKMTEQVLDIFKRINALSADETENENEIIKAIDETMRIKIDSLAETKVEFEKRTTFNYSYKISPQDVETMKETAVEVCITYGGEDLINEILQTGLFVKHVSGFAQARKNASDERDRYILKFLREHLLYEIATFEEIMHYSVGKLRESEEQRIKDYVTAMDACMAEVFEALKAQEITMIHPEPHTMFSGKEAEVLVAEKHEGFNRGEIIKTITNGYRAGELVIMRANVICAQ